MAIGSLTWKDLGFNYQAAEGRISSAKNGREMLASTLQTIGIPGKWAEEKLYIAAINTAKENIE